MNLPAASAEPPTLRTHTPGQGAPVELGSVRWERDHAAARARARAEDRPLLVLFQEVPGCRTCKDYGSDVLSHPLLVEAAEEHFVPVAVLNNVGGADRRVLERYAEPAWNNPVVRIVDAADRALAPRLSGPYSVEALAARMAAALEAKGAPVPRYLADLAPRDYDHATFAMACFWSGEVALGGLPGVTRTRTGWLQGREVVDLEYDPAALGYDALVRRAKAGGAAAAVFTRSAEQQRVAAGLVGRAARREDGTPRWTPGDDKYQIRRTAWRFLPMTETQASRVNAAVGRSQDPTPFFSPRQLRLLAHIRRHPDAGWPVALGSEDLRRAWNRAVEVAVGLPG